MICSHYIDAIITMPYSCLASYPRLYELAAAVTLHGCPASFLPFNDFMFGLALWVVDFLHRL